MSRAAFIIEIDTEDPGQSWHVLTGPGMATAEQLRLLLLDALALSSTRLLAVVQGDRGRAQLHGLLAQSRMNGHARLFGFVPPPATEA